MFVFIFESLYFEIEIKSCIKQEEQDREMLMHMNFIPQDLSEWKR